MTVHASRRYLIDEENMDPKDEVMLELAVMELVEEMYGMASKNLPWSTSDMSSDEDGALDAETLATIDGRSDSIAEKARASASGHESSQHAYDPMRLSDADKVMDEQIVQLIEERVKPLVEEQLAWEAAIAEQGVQLPDLDSPGVAGWGVPGR